METVMREENILGCSRKTSQNGFEKQHRVIKQINLYFRVSALIHLPWWGPIRKRKGKHNRSKIVSLIKVFYH